jgi:hypothetical protein
MKLNNRKNSPFIFSVHILCNRMSQHIQTMAYTSVLSFLNSVSVCELSYTSVRLFSFLSSLFYAYTVFSACVCDTALYKHTENIRSKFFLSNCLSLIYFGLIFFLVLSFYLQYVPVHSANCVNIYIVTYTRVLSSTLL